MRQTFQTALDDLGRRLGVPDGLPLSEDGAATITLDDVEIGVRYLEAADAVQFCAVVGMLPERPGAGLLTALLASNNLQNMSDGGAIGCDMSDRSLTLNMRFPTDFLTSQQLETELDRFATIAEAWRANYPPVAAAAAAAAATDGAPGSDEETVLRL